VADPVTVGFVGLAVVLAGPALRALQIIVRSRMAARLERARGEALAEVLRAMPAGGTLCERRHGSLLIVVSPRPAGGDDAPAPRDARCSRQPTRLRRSGRSPRCGLQPGACHGPRPGA
jgi:hypothetical protein